VTGRGTVSRPTDTARTLLARAIQDRIFPAAVAEAGDAHGVLWRDAFGALTFEENARSCEPGTVFDLASLTKPIATTTLALDLVGRGVLSLEEPLARSFDEWRAEDRAGVTVRDLLEHASGLPARLLDPPPGTRREFIHDICEPPLEYRPREKSVYSDLGFILLSSLIEDRYATLDTSYVKAFAAVSAQADDMLTFEVDERDRARTAPTWPEDNDRRLGRFLIGEVHDNYAAILGPSAGHAGLFGTAGAVGSFARMLLRGARRESEKGDVVSADTVALMTTKSTVPGSSRALGWDTMLPSSSCGTELSPAAFGHVGFTGTSLWIDPVLDRYFVLLTNRACRGGTLDQMRDVRRAFHDALARI
jgi:CubicO group peptidase (beta-lactamase class C family)